MKKEITVKKEVDIKILEVHAGVRYWEDSSVNGVEDERGDLIPCRFGEVWKPIIEIETGRIINWELGKKANIHYKVCDDGTYILKDNEDNIVISKQGYVPHIMCPEENGYGDYIIMNINEKGIIEDWNTDDLDDLIIEED